MGNKIGYLTIEKDKLNQNETKIAEFYSRYSPIIPFPNAIYQLSYISFSNKR